MTTPTILYDLAYYAADLARLPRFSGEERQQLLLAVQNHPQDILARNRLLESCLSYVLNVALHHCPPPRYQLLPDLVEEVNLSLLQVFAHLEHYEISYFSGFLTAWTQGIMKHAITDHLLIKVPHGTLSKAMQQGTVQRFYDMQPVSLDARMQADETTRREEPYTLPILSPEAAPTRDPQQRAQVETFLSYLSPRAQAILRLRYGLADDNERRHTTQEIAHLLGISRKVVFAIESEALARLRALVAGKATLYKRNGKPCIYYPGARHHPTLPLEQEATLQQASCDLEARGVIVTGRLLAEATGISLDRARLFLRQHRTESAKAARARQRQQKMEQVYACLQAQGRRVTGELLAKEAGVASKTAVDFLKAYRSKPGEESVAELASTIGKAL